MIDPILRVSLEVQPFARAIVGCSAREVAFLRIEDEVTGRVGFGECAPLPGLHRESLDEALSAIEDWMDGIREVDELPPSAAFARPPAGEIAVEPCTDLAAWLDIMVTGFGTPDTQGVASHESFDRAVLERVIGDFAAAAGVLLFLARCGGAAAGAGAMRVHGGVAQLCGAATLPAFRRRGVQTALLQHRLVAAVERGAELCVMTTQPGSKSMQNACRQGFALLYARLVLQCLPRA